ncbi:EAL domain-containing protein [Shewanella sp. MMG014]|uniref:putative bifunctional diguanylate cyclase/phosphodiesterase n=1 Tax=Shewanella sp. MMG014 TaxID=2822691 RepID=UPI001B36036E|nr:EAL domain-containing protein [Shewanella sp. MMG014]MBQ4889534.1 EAL domain-containing protein [Shewanella sp. MMG014]
MVDSEFKSVWVSEQSSELSRFLSSEKVTAEVERLTQKLDCDGVVIVLSQISEHITSDCVVQANALKVYDSDAQTAELLGLSLASYPDLCEQLLLNNHSGLFPHCDQVEHDDLHFSAPLVDGLNQFCHSLAKPIRLLINHVAQIGHTRLCLIPYQHQANWSVHATGGDDCQFYLTNEFALKLCSHAELTRVSELLQNKEIQYLELFQQLPVACALIGTDNNVSNQNHVASQSLPFTIGKSLFSVINSDDHLLLEDCLHIVREGALHQSWCELPLIVSGVKHWYKMSFCRALDIEHRLLMMVEDISERYRLADELSFQSNYDPLTGLPNRVQFEAMLEETINEKDRLPACVAFLDLDQFQVINDVSGHQAGDELLCQVSKRLSLLLRTGDIVARLGGDEFGILMYHADKASAEQVASRICQQLSEHEFTWGEITHNVSMSMGMSELNSRSEDIYSVMSQADAACRIAKEDGRNRWHFYSKNDPQMHQLYNQMLASVDIISALALNQFELFFQLIEPLSSKDTGIHMEILLRMVQEDGRYVSPGVFLPAAERYNLASRIDRWVIDNLLKWGSRHMEIWDDLKMVSLNLSAVSLSDSKFMSWLEMRLMVEPELVDKLCFEITETAAVSQLEQATALIDLLKPLGCKLALDDFGSGFSSFAYLKCLDVDYVKIDGQFVVNVCDDRSDKAIVSAICQLGKDMDFEVIGEFVENQNIGLLLRELGVDYAQGYAIGKPTRLMELDSGLRQPWLND